MSAAGWHWPHLWLVLNGLELAFIPHSGWYNILTKLPFEFLLSHNLAHLTYRLTLTLGSATHLSSAGSSKGAECGPWSNPAWVNRTVSAFSELVLYCWSSSPHPQLSPLFPCFLSFFSSSFLTNLFISVKTQGFYILTKPIIFWLAIPQKKPQALWRGIKYLF